MNGLVSHARIMKNPSIDRLKTKLSWPPCWGQETQMPLQPNSTPAWTPHVSSIWFDSSRCFWGRAGGTRVPWWLTQGWRFGEYTLTFVVGAAGSPPPPSYPLGDLSLAVWPFVWPLDTVHVSHVRLFGMFDFVQQRDLQQNTNIRFVSRKRAYTDEFFF